jgi:hypothetical protein
LHAETMASRKNVSWLTVQVEGDEVWLEIRQAAWLSL